MCRLSKNGTCIGALPKSRRRQQHHDTGFVWYFVTRDFSFFCYILRVAVFTRCPSVVIVGHSPAIARSVQRADVTSNRREEECARPGVFGDAEMCIEIHIHVLLMCEWVSLVLT